MPTTNPGGVAGEGPPEVGRECSASSPSRRESHAQWTTEDLRRRRTTLLHGPRRYRKDRARTREMPGGSSARSRPERADRGRRGSHGSVSRGAVPALRGRSPVSPCRPSGGSGPTMTTLRGTGVSVTRRSPKPQRQVRFLGSPLRDPPSVQGATCGMTVSGRIRQRFRASRGERTATGAR